MITQPSFQFGSPDIDDVGRFTRLEGDGYLSSTFKRLYYHLYSNSTVSRAERIMDDLYMILLCKLLEAQRSAAKNQIERFVEFAGSADEILLGVLHDHFPHLIAPGRRFSVEDDLIRWTLSELALIDVTTAPAHIVGDAFQALIGPSLRGDRGQFFTPRSLVEAMVKIIAPKPYENVLDPACGTGGFLSETHVYQSQLAKNDSPTGHIVGIDKDFDMFRFGSALLEIIAPRRSHIFHCNSLDSQAWENIVQPNGFEEFDVILTNPPFGSRIGIRENEILSHYDFGHRWNKTSEGHVWQKSNTLAPSQHPQILFLELCVRRLRPGGRLGIVLPEGVFGNVSQGFVWSWLRKRGRIYALLDCPRTTFQPSTDTKTNVLFFEKARVQSATSVMDQQKVRIGVAVSSGHDRRGRSQLKDGVAHPDDFKRLGSEFHGVSNSAVGWQDVVLRNPEYLVPRYHVDRVLRTSEEEELIGDAPSATLNDLVSSGLMAVRKGHEPGADTYGTGNIPFIRTSDITNFELSANPTNGISNSVYTKFARQQQLRPNDVLIVVDGRYRIGATALLTSNNFRCVVQSHFRILRPLHPETLNCYELMFALNLPSVRMRIRNLVFVQSTLGTLGKRLFELRIPILNGDGPWRESVDRFSNALMERDRLLPELTDRYSTDIDL